MPTVFVETLASLLPAQPAPAGRMLSETLFTLLAGVASCSMPGGTITTT
jgi:hypothetical protein